MVAALPTTSALPAHPSESAAISQAGRLDDQEKFVKAHNSASNEGLNNMTNETSSLEPTKPSPTRLNSYNRHQPSGAADTIFSKTDVAATNRTAKSQREASDDLRSGRWTLDEKILFLYGLNKFGKGRWKKMSIYLPHRSLVQIKSHAQKVLKRLEAGENVYRRMEENRRRLEVLVADAHKRVGLPGTDFNAKRSKRKSRVAVAAAAAAKSARTNNKRATKKLKENTTIRRATKAKTVNENQKIDVKGKFPATSTGSEVSHNLLCAEEMPFGLLQFQSNMSSLEDASGKEGAVIAAAALCQLSSCGAQWDRSTALFA